MTDAGTLWRVVPRPIRETPADLAAVIVVIVATNLAVFVPGLSETPIRIPLGLVSVLFLPGYALAAALFPRGERPHPDAEGDSSASNRTRDDSNRRWSSQPSLSGGERLVLSIAMSVSIVPILGLILNFGLGTIDSRSFIGAISAVTLVETAVGTIRRSTLPPSDRFRVPYDRWYAETRESFSDGSSRPDAVIRLSVVVVLLLAIGSVGYAVVALQPNEQFSAAYVTTETDDGQLVAGEYPRSFEEGEGQEFVFGLENHERRPVDYTVVVVQQAVDPDDGSIDEQTELQRFGTRLEHNQTWHHPHEVEPTLTGENVRIAWLVYPDGDVPAEPSVENAAYSTYRWIEVTAAEE